MDPNELIKAVPDVAKVAGPLAAAIPFTGIVKRMLGPAADEIAEMWRDQVRLYRYERQLKCVEKAERMAKNAGFTPQAVPPKILFPLLEGASMEEDETLHDMWAALLANAASPDNAANVRPGFIATLRQMAPDEATVLKWIVELDGEPMHADGVPSQWLLDYYGREKLGPGHPILLTGEGDELPKLHSALAMFGTCMNGLEANGLIHKTTVDTEEGDVLKYFITWRGYSLVRAVRPPAPKK